MSASLSPGNFGRDENDWFGSRDQDAEEAASKSLAATAARVVGAKPFPIAAKRLEELTRTTNVRIEQVVVVLESDPALSARLLRLVNSAGYGLKVRCTSVRHAAVLVGTRRLNQVATTAAILDLFESSNTLAAELLEHAAIVGSLCRYLAVHLGLPQDELFTCGFLHDIGKIMLLDTEREVYPALLREFGGNADSVHEQERRVFGFDHATLGAHVLTAWNIPEPVPKVIGWHHQPARALQDSLLSAMVQTLRLADLLAYELGRRQEQEGISLVAASEAAQYLDISEPQLAAMWRDLANLRDRSKARSHGEPELEAADPRLEVPQSLRPRGSLSPRSMKPSLAPTRGSLMPSEDGPGSVRPPSDHAKKVPDKLACVVCGTGSYGNLCQACGGHVCPSHQVGADEWCSLCEEEFADFKLRYRLPPSALTGAAAVVVVSLIGSVASAWSAGNTGFSALLAPLLLSVVWAIVLPIGSKLWVKLRFMRELKPRTAPQPSIDTSGQPVKGPPEQLMPIDGQADLPSMPSIVPEYDRTTLHTSVAPPVEPFAAGLAALLPPAEERNPVPSERRPVSEPPPSSRGPMVIRVEVPSFSAASASISPRLESTLPTSDGQLSAIARALGGGALSERPREEHAQLDEAGASSVMPKAPSVPPPAEASAVQAAEPPYTPTPASMVPSYDAPEISVGVLSMPHLRVEPKAEAAAPVPTPAPVLIPLNPAPALAEAAPAPQKVLTLTPGAAPQKALSSDLAPNELESGVRHTLLRNEPGILREACGGVVYNSCS
ncbi:MAG TPA: HDOD domain-containing protein [Polyangiaceae bacterium]|nr:HDOD domain-containing protein [Polyangiaceae bacterium]